MTFMINDNGIDRPMTDNEIAELKELQKNAAIKAEAQIKAETELAAKKALAEAKLAELGLTSDDLRALGLG